jgi:hypothetical protein
LFFCREQLAFVSARGTRLWLRFPTHKVRALAYSAARAQVSPGFSFS